MIFSRCAQPLCSKALCGEISFGLYIYHGCLNSVLLTPYDFAVLGVRSLCAAKRSVVKYLLRLLELPLTNSSKRVFTT